jgi:hypothetical protein
MSTITIDIDTLRTLIGAPTPSAPAPATQADDTIRDTYPAIVRTYADGVWVGTVIEERGCRVVLRDCRCIWHWSHETLPRLGLAGVASRPPQRDDKLTVQIPRHICIDAVGITPITDEIHAAWMAAPAYHP